MWHLKLFLAKLGFFKYNGIPDFYNGPKGRVRYPGSPPTMPLPLGNAVEYASMFNGKVIPEDYRI